MRDSRLNAMARAQASINIETVLDDVPKEWCGFDGVLYIMKFAHRWPAGGYDFYVCSEIFDKSALDDQGFIRALRKAMTRELVDCKIRCWRIDRRLQKKAPG